MAPVKFFSEVAKKDYLIIAFRILISDKKYWLSVVFAFCVIDIILGSFLPNSFKYSIVFTVALVVIVIIYRLVNYFQKLSLPAAKKEFEKIDWEINQDGVRGLGNTFSVEISMKDVLKVSETKKYFFVFVVKDINNYYVIPKAGIAGTDLKLVRSFFNGKLCKLSFEHK